MILAERMRKRMEECDVSQSELARRVGVSQTTIAKLVSGRGYGSKHLHRIARVLATTPAYLDGDTDDPDLGAPIAPPPAPAAIYLRVELPTEEALTEMFDALLEGVEFAESRLERAQLLARRLPIGLAQLHDARPAPARKHRRAAVSEDAAEAGSTRQREPQS